MAITAIAATTITTANITAIMVTRAIIVAAVADTLGVIAPPTVEAVITGQGAAEIISREAAANIDQGLAANPVRGVAEAIAVAEEARAGAPLSRDTLAVVAVFVAGSAAAVSGGAAEGAALAAAAVAVAAAGRHFFEMASGAGNRPPPSIMAGQLGLVYVPFEYAALELVDCGNLQCLGGTFDLDLGGK
jgi:hypothetical protein